MFLDTQYNNNNLIYIFRTLVMQVARNFLKI